MQNFIFCAVRMIADIFYPRFTLTITILACFSQKKATLFGGIAPMPSPRHYPGHPRPPVAIVFGFAKN